MPARTRERRRVRWAAALAALMLAVIGFAVDQAVSGAGHAHQPTAASSSVPGGQPSSAPAAPAAVQGSSAPAGTGPGSSAAGVGSASASASASTPPASGASVGPVTARALTVARVSAFGPGGGDGAAQALRAIGGNPAAPWRTDWYATSDFGLLYSGTGLLVDMGQPVTVTSVRLSMGTPGASLQLRAGDQPAAASLRTVASSAATPATVLLTLRTPVHVRYLLIWFTELPPDGAGTYQASIYQIAVRGQR
jgi:hypothetical protein